MSKLANLAAKTIGNDKVWQKRRAAGLKKLTRHQISLHGYRIMTNNERVHSPSEMPVVVSLLPHVGRP
jgi:hypothetical protein